MDDMQTPRCKMGVSPLRIPLVCCPGTRYSVKPSGSQTHGDIIYIYVTTIKMFTAKNIVTDHKDLIHDVSYDFYGKRMATCSSDQSVKVCETGCALNRITCCATQVWDFSEGGQWRCTASWKVIHTKSSLCPAVKQL